MSTALHVNVPRRKFPNLVISGDVNRLIVCSFLQVDLVLTAFHIQATKLGFPFSSRFFVDRTQFSKRGGGLTGAVVEPLETSVVLLNRELQRKDNKTSTLSRLIITHLLGALLQDALWSHSEAVQYATSCWGPCCTVL